MEANCINRYGVVCETGTDHPISPEAKLWMRVIVQAIDEFDRRRSSTSSSAQDSAREWFASESDAVGSFVWTCHVIEVDPNFIRSRLAKKHRMKNENDAVMTTTTQGVKSSTVIGYQIFAIRSQSRLAPTQDSRVEAVKKDGASKEKVSSYEMSQLGTAFTIGKSPLLPGIAVKISR